MGSNNDQFEHGRIPLRPLSLRNKNLANTNELIVDYGEDASYHIYIAHHADPTRLIDITSLIVQEMLPKVEINGNQFTITIEGQKDPANLKDIINFIYKRFTYAEDPSGFVYEEDIHKIFDPTTVNVLLRTTDGQIQLPITIADNVYDKNGKSIQERLDNMVKLGFSVSYLYTTQQNQTSYEFDYPFEDYPDLLEVRIGTTYVDNSRYSITKHYDGEGHYKSGTLTFIGESIENGRRIDLVWIFNTVYEEGGKLEFMSGSKIADSTIPLCKMEKYSNSYNYADSNSVATSKALADLYQVLTQAINANNQNVFYCPDASNRNSSVIRANINRAPANNDVLIITTDCDKKANTSLTIGTYSNSISPKTYQIVYPDGGAVPKGYKSNQVIKVKIDNGKAVLLNGSEIELRNTKYVHNCLDQEYNISFANLDYKTGDLIHVYRNGVRLFQDIDYSINLSKEIITLFVRTEENERIIIEALGI